MCFIMKSCNFTSDQDLHSTVQKSQQLKPYIKFNTEKRIEPEKNGDKDGKALYKLINIVVCSKTMECLRYRIDVKLVRNI